MRSWFSTGLHAIWSPGANGRAVRLKHIALRRLCLLNLSVASLAFLIPGALTLAFAPRMLSLTQGGKRTLVIDDQGLLLAAASLVGLPTYLGITLWTSGQRLLRGRNCRESYWAAMALTGFPICFAALFLLFWSLFLRSPPRDAVYEPPVGVLGLFVVAAIANRFLVVFAAMLTSAIVHCNVFHHTRFTNLMRTIAPNEA